jgi:hypothetical protein
MHQTIITEKAAISLVYLSPKNHSRLDPAGPVWK